MCKLFVVDRNTWWIDGLVWYGFFVSFFVGYLMPKLSLSENSNDTF